MPVCHVCGYENKPGALICGQCYAPLAWSVAGQPDTTQDKDNLLLEEQNDVAPPHHTRHVNLLGPDSVALYIAGAEEPLIIQLTHEAILGRYTPSSAVQPRVDLTPYGAYHKGLSRLHAAIRRTQDNLLVAVDLGSSNGSWLNGMRMEPRRLYALRSGDRLVLSQIEVVVYFSD
jgi:hypothetical protein